MEKKSKLVIILSVLWMIIAAGLFVAVLLKWMDRETFKVVFAAGFVVFSVVVSVMTLGGQKKGSDG